MAQPGPSLEFSFHEQSFEAVPTWGCARIVPPKATWPAQIDGAVDQVDGEALDLGFDVVMHGVLQAGGQWRELDLALEQAVPDAVIEGVGQGCPGQAERDEHKALHPLLQV